MTQEHEFSWYLGTEHPRSIMIGPRGHNSREWRELEAVCTPKEWWRNGFYMDAECRCVMNRHDLHRFFDSKRVKTEREAIHYSNISCEVPGYPFSAATIRLTEPA